jgi:uncharacterized protein (DUF2147 family)
MRTNIAVMFIALLFAGTLHAQDQICHTWYTEGGESTVEIYAGADGKYYGKITWIKEGFKNGKPLMNSYDPDESKRNLPVLGLQIISGLNKKSATEWVGGKIYDPSKGNFYSCKMTVQGNKLLLHGYILGIPFLGRTTTWTLKPDVPQQAPAKPVTPGQIVTVKSHT